MKIAIATASELKIRALKNALEKLKLKAEILSGKTSSGIPEQPIGYEETAKGARNRVLECQKNFDADISIAVESGVMPIEGSYFDIGCVHVISKEGSESIAFSSGYFIPDWMIEEVKGNGTDIGIIAQRLSGGKDKDPLSYFSGELIKREDSLSQAIILALVKLFYEDKYKQR
jgi:inosine/xanthosine triphosphatase